jgi:hypothetical protein
MEKKMDIFKKIGSWLFLIGIVVAIIAGIIVGTRLYTDTGSYITLLLGILGFIVGILSFFAIGQITKEKVPTFLIGALMLVVIVASASVWNTWGFINNQDFIYLFQSITGYLAIFAAPAAGILAIRAIWDSGKSEELDNLVPKLTK